MSYSFNLIVKSDVHPDDPRRTLDILVFPTSWLSAIGYIIWKSSTITFVQPSPITWNNSENRLNKAQSRITQVVLEFGPLNVSSADPIFRVKQLI